MKRDRSSLFGVRELTEPRGDYYLHLRYGEGEGCLVAEAKAGKDGVDMPWELRGGGTPERPTLRVGGFGFLTLDCTDATCARFC